MNAATLQQEILSLSAKERAEMIDILWDSLAGPELKARESAWAEESERRIDAFEAGRLGARDARDVMADLKKKFLK